MQHIGVIGLLALRNLRRHLHRTLLTAVAMLVGGALLMFSLSIGDGTHESWIESGVRMGTGGIGGNRRGNRPVYAWESGNRYWESGESGLVYGWESGESKRKTS